MNKKGNVLRAEQKAKKAKRDRDEGLLIQLEEEEAERMAKKNRMEEGQKEMAEQLEAPNCDAIAAAWWATRPIGGAAHSMIRLMTLPNLFQRSMPLRASKNG